MSELSEPRRVAVVTGAARGIGAAVVRRLVAQGCWVTAIDWCLDADAPTSYPQASKAEFMALAADYAGRVQAVVADVRDGEALAATAEATVERWGRLDVAVAAAAVMAGGRAQWETPEEELDLLWDVDAKGVWHTAVATVPHMLAGPDPAGCRFVAVTSAAGSRGLFHLAGYGAAKHAVVGMVRGLAADLVGTGVTAAAVSPGSTRTRMLEATAELYDLPDAEELASAQLLRRLLDPDELAAAVCFCASREGGVVNGSVLHADGGFQG